MNLKEHKKLLVLFLKASYSFSYFVESIKGWVLGLDQWSSFCSWIKPRLGLNFMTYNGLGFYPMSSSSPHLDYHFYVLDFWGPWIFLKHVVECFKYLLEIMHEYTLLQKVVEPLFIWFYLHLKKKEYWIPINRGSYKLTIMCLSLCPSVHLVQSFTQEMAISFFWYFAWW